MRMNEFDQMENLATQDHPNHGPAPAERKIGEDQAPFDLDPFGTREIKYHIVSEEIEPADKAAQRQTTG